jgi:hypothetical protein
MLLWCFGDGFEGGKMMVTSSSVLDFTMAEGVRNGGQWVLMSTRKDFTAFHSYW